MWRPWNHSDFGWAGRSAAAPTGLACSPPAFRRLLLAVFLVLAVATRSTAAAPLQLTSFDRAGALAWTGAPVPGICRMEIASRPRGPWAPGPSVFSTGSSGAAPVPLGEDNRFLRLLAVEVPATRAGFSNLVGSYGLLETIAGNGAGQEDGVSFWLPDNEGQPGPWVALSRPHMAMADQAGRVYIADKNSHSVLRVDLDGSIHTHAGTHLGGFDGEGPAVATNLQLSLPNGLWVRADGTVYILDTGNGRIRRVDTHGVMSTVFLATGTGSSLNGGRGLWVGDDETLAYFCAGTRVRSWTPSGGLRTLASGFTELGTLWVEANGDVLVCDRGGHRVYRISPSGTSSVLAGNGTPSGGGDGEPALATGLNGVRSIWPVPTGGYLLLTHDGCQLWYLDTAGVVHLLLQGAGGSTHGGDGEFFYDPTAYKISEGRSVTMDAAGHILICESDYGFVRRIRFQSMKAGP